MLFEIILLGMSQDAGMMPTMTPHVDECSASLPGVFQHPEEIEPLIFLNFATIFRFLRTVVICIPTRVQEQRSGYG